MFSLLGDKLQEVFKDLRGQGRISESNVNDALRQVRLALLEADVHFQVAKDFIARVKEKALGQDVLLSVSPGQQIVKIFYDEMTALLGGDAAPLNVTKPARILIVGLNGAGKTTTSAKLASYLRTQLGRAPALVACDLLRPAAVEQLGTLAGQVGVPIFKPQPGETDVLRVARESLAWIDSQPGINTAIFDTAGRQEIDEPLVQELKRLKEFLQPQEVLLVCDAATGQQAVSVAEHFHAALGVTGIILTKLDGDARGGAALSLRSVTGRPIKFAGTGEKLDAFEIFHPDRLAQRILGMGDVVTLVEKAAQAMDEDEARRLEKRVMEAKFDLEDFLAQFKFMRKLGPLESILGMIPGMSQIKDLKVDPKELSRIEAIVLSMTIQERRKPDLLNAKRRIRIANGSGTTVTQVNDLMRKFEEMRKMMKQMGKMKHLFAKGGNPAAAMRGMMPPGSGGGGKGNSKAFAGLPKFRR